MSEDAGEHRRRRATTAEGRKTPSRMPEGVLRESWPPRDEAQHPAPAVDDETEAALDALEGHASEGRCDTIEMPIEQAMGAALPKEPPSDESAPSDAPQLQNADEEKTLPRIRLEDYASIEDERFPEPAAGAGVDAEDVPTPLPPRHESEPDALTNPRIAIAGLGFSQPPHGHEDSEGSVVTRGAVVVIAPARIISDAPPPADTDDTRMAVVEDFEHLGEPEAPRRAAPQPEAFAVSGAESAASTAGSATADGADVAVEISAVDVAVTEPPAAAELEIEDSGLHIVDVEVIAAAQQPRTPPPPPPSGARADALSSPASTRPKPPPPTAARADAASAPPARPKPPPPPAAPKADDGQKRKQARQWWERFFSDDYLMTVRPPTQAQIAKQVDFIEASLALGKGATVLDVGCGLGLHSIELARRGHLVVGLDLSLAMITRAAEAAQEIGLKINFVHADIREMEFEGAFDGVICMGTTLGFFDEDGNRDMLVRLHQALKPGGRLVLDVVNRDYVVSAQPNLVWFEGDGCVCMEESDFNYFTSRLSVKRTMMREDGRQTNAEYTLRLYSLHELGQLMQQTGFRVIEVSGQEAIRGAFFGVCSPRIVMLAERRIPNRASAVLPPERTSAEVARPSTAMPPERGSAEFPKPPKPE